MRTFRAVAPFAMVVFLSACAGSKPEQPPVAAPASPAPAPPVVSPAAKPPAPALPPPPPTPAAEPPRPVSPLPAPGSPPERPERILHIKTDLANFREGPGTKAKILRVLRKGTPVTVLEEKDQWFRVRLDDGREGWIAESVAAE